VELVEAFFQAECHVVDQTVEELLEVWVVQLLSHLLLEVLRRPEPLEYLGTVVSILELGIEHAAGASKLDVYIELDERLHESGLDDL
jgi:hypothetical protein